MADQFYNFDAPREFLVLNAGDEPVELTYDAETFRIPAGSEIQHADARGRESGKNAAGEYIPGSLIVRDIYGYRGSPDEQPGQNLRGDRWSATNFVMHCLKIDPKNQATYEGSGLYKQRGISLLPLNPAPDLVQRVRQAARERYERFIEGWANDTLRTYAEKAAKYRGMGREDLLPGNDYHKALVVIQAAKEKLQRARAVAGVQESDFAEPAESEADLSAFMRQAAESAAYKLKEDRPETDMDAVVEVMMQNPEFRKKLKESYNMRKKRGKKAEASA